MAEKEYIEREAALKQNYFSESKTPDDNYRFNAEIKFCISSLPAADVEPVRHGHWKKSKGYERPTENGFVHDDRYVCDCCGWGCCCETKLDFNFCPNCGAKMDRSV